MGAYNDRKRAYHYDHFVSTTIDYIDSIIEVAERNNDYDRYIAASFFKDNVLSHNVLELKDYCKEIGNEMRSKM